MNILSVWIHERRSLWKSKPGGNACRHSTHLFGKVVKFGFLKMQRQRAIGEMKITAIAHREFKLWAWSHSGILLDNPITIFPYVMKAFHTFGVAVVRNRTHSD